MIKVRDFIVEDLNYFTDFIDNKDEQIDRIISQVNSGEIIIEKVPNTKYFIFLRSLERLIACYSGGRDIDFIKDEFSNVLNNMVEGWDDNVVKFKKGRPQVIYDKYMLNEYCYMVWMLSLAVLLNVSNEKVLVLCDIIEKGNIDDELINLFMSFLIHKKRGVVSKTTYKPFKALVDDGCFIKEKPLSVYLKKWYMNTKLLTWHNYDASIDTSKYYYGYWAFEAGAISVMQDLDDSLFRDNQFYPKDLVDYYRDTR